MPAGRPKKTVTAEDVATTEPSVLLSVCKKCGAPSSGAHKDTHGNWRCHCSDDMCGYWDGMVYNSAEDAAAGWESSGNPNDYEDSPNN